MGRKRIPWYLRYKRVKRDFSSAHFIPFDKLEERHLQQLRANPFGGNNQMEERIVSVRIGTTLDKLDALVNKALDKIDGEYVDHRIHNIGLQNIVTIVFKPLGGGTNGG